MAQCSRQCCSWFKRYCCCCCKCCCDNSVDTTTVHTPLLAKKEPPVEAKDGFSELQVKEEGAGETQLMEVMVVDEDESKESPQLSEKIEKTVPAGKEAQPTVSSPPQSEPSTFVRGTGSRSSWRVVPSITSQARDAAAQNSASTKVESVVTSAQKTVDTSTPEQAKEDVDSNRHKEEYDRNVVLLPQELDEDESAPLEETNVTITFGFNDSKPDPQQQSKDIQSQQTVKSGGYTQD